MTATASASASCALAQTPLLPEPIDLGAIPVQVGPITLVFIPELQVYVDAEGSVSGQLTTGVQASATATGGLQYKNGRLSHIASLTHQFTSTPPTITSGAAFGAHVEPSIDLSLYGLGGPAAGVKTGLDFVANPAQSPWWTLSAPLDLTASLAIPVLDLHTGDLNLSSHEFTIAQATSPPPSPTSPTTPSTPIIPSTGSTLVDASDTQLVNDPSDQEFTNWQAATGEDVDVEDSLPADIYGYRCVVLLANQLLDQSDTTEIQNYLNAGGTVLAIGEWANDSDGDSGYASADDALNAFSSTIGAGLTLNEDTWDDSGDTVTNNIESSPLTQGVFSLGDNKVSSLSISAPAVPLIDTNDDATVPFIGEQAIGTGTYIVSGDSNAFTDNDGGEWDGTDNTQFVQNLCP